MSEQTVCPKHGLFYGVCHTCLKEAKKRGEQKRLDDLKSENARLVSSLEKLACLGNGSHYGNSDGNVIAQRALGLNPSEVYSQIAPRTLNMEGDRMAVLATEAPKPEEESTSKQGD